MNPTIRLRDYEPEQWLRHLAHAFVDAWVDGEALVVDLDGTEHVSEAFFKTAFEGLPDEVGLSASTIWKGLNICCNLGIKDLVEQILVQKS